MNARSIAAPLAVFGLLTVAALAGVGCSAKTRVELESASAPAVQPADGGDGQNDADVVDAGVVDIDEPIESTTTAAPTTTATTTTVATAGIDLSASTSTDAPRAEVDDATKQLCRNEKRMLKSAIEDFRADQGTSPTGEGDLIAFAYVRTVSALYDVRVDGSIVVQGDTCVGVH